MLLTIASACKRKCEGVRGLQGVLQADRVDGLGGRGTCGLSIGQGGTGTTTYRQFASWVYPGLVCMDAFALERKVLGASSLGHT